MKGFKILKTRNTKPSFGIFSSGCADYLFQKKKIENSLILSAPHETTFANISPVIDLMIDSYNLIYLCQCNYYKEKSNMCEKISDNYEIISICLKNPFKFKSFYDPSFLHRLFINLCQNISYKKN